MNKRITYNRETRDFDMFLDGEYVGSRADRSQAESDLDILASSLEVPTTHPHSDLPIPAAIDIADRAADLAGDARRQGDARLADRRNRVRMNVLRGARLAWHRGELLVASVNTPGAVYAVSAEGCTCPSEKPCWHIELRELLLEMQATAADTADIEADRAAARASRMRSLMASEAMRQMDELFAA